MILENVEIVVVFLALGGVLGAATALFWLWCWGKREVEYNDDF